MIHAMVYLCRRRNPGFYTCQNNGAGRVYRKNGTQPSAAGDRGGPEYADFYCSIQSCINEEQVQHVDSAK